MRKSRIITIRIDCGSFHGGIAFQIDAGDASVCIDSAGLLAYRRFNSKFSILNSIYEKLPLFAMSAVFCVVTYVAQAGAGRQRIWLRCRLVCG